MPFFVSDEQKVAVKYVNLPDVLNLLLGVSMIKIISKVQLVGVAVLSVLFLTACPIEQRVVAVQETQKIDDTGKILATNISCDNQLIIESFVNQRSDIQVKGCGRVVAVLPDDNQGSRHQRMIVALSDTHDHTILIAHNIDLAPNVPDVKKGDMLVFYGEYEYNDKGGVIHWTHHDPAGRHQDGWIQKNGIQYK